MTDSAARDPGLDALSPVDGRYAARVKDLRGYFSEAALIRHRVRVEAEWFRFLALDLKLPELAGLAPAVLAFAWGLQELDRVGWTAGFIYMTATAMRLARFNIQTHAPSDRRYFVGMPSPAAAGPAR